VRLFLFLAFVSLQAGPAIAQNPTISPTITRGLNAPAIPVWLFARSGQPLNDIVQMVVGAGGTVRHRSEWLNAVSADIPGTVLQNGAIDFPVRHIQRIGFLTRQPNDPPVSSQPLTRSSPATRIDYGPSEMPLRVLNALPLAEDYNLTGTGITIAMLDTGFETGLPIFSSTVVADQWDFIFGDSIVRNEAADVVTQSNHGTGTWSLLGAQLPGTIVGLAPDATYLLAKTEDVRSETRTEEDNFVAALEWAAARGADIATASLGYLAFDDGFSYTAEQLDGDVAVTTVAVDSAVAGGMVVVVSVGNDGPQLGSLASPADADSAISVGAIDSLGGLASFSSRGPTSDGRIKPDVTAPGVAVFVASPVSPSGFARVNGTSFSAPLIAGVAALIKQASRNLTPIEIGDALRFTGSNTALPDNNSGWGTPNAEVSALFPLGIRINEPSADTLTSVTPTISWDHRSVPLFASPVTTRFLVTTVPDGNTVFDSSIVGGSVTLTVPQPPGLGSLFNWRQRPRIP
jgi:serine protease AprX